jgi:hypothetical protein
MSLDFCELTTTVGVELMTIDGVRDASSARGVAAMEARTGAARSGVASVAMAAARCRVIGLGRRCSLLMFIKAVDGILFPTVAVRLLA